MTTPARIRWSAGAEKWVTAWFGSVGTVDPHLFSILRPMAPDDEWALTSGLPGFAGRASYGGGPEPLKTEAERWLAQFVASLGASFPEDTDREREDVLRKFAPPAPSRPAEHVAPLETGEPWRGPAQADWDDSR